MDELEPKKGSVAESATNQVYQRLNDPPGSTTNQVSHSLSKLLEDYLKYHRYMNHTAATLHHKRKELNLFIRWLQSQGHSLQVQDVTALDVMGHLQDMQERGLKPSSINTRLRSIRAWVNWMVKWEVIDSNPVAKLETVKVPKIRKPFLTKDAFQALLDICPLSELLGARRQAMLWLFLTSGIRRAEMSMLQLDDLLWEQDAVRVIYGKGQKERLVSFTGEAQMVMMRYLRLRNDDRPWVWVNYQKTPQRLGYEGIGKDMDKLFQRAGLKGQIKDVCHIFRRTLAANAVRQGVTRPHIMGHMGWSTEAMIAHYTAAMEMEAEAIEQFQKLEPFGGQ